MRRSRYPLPARITLVLILVLISTVWNLVRVWSSLSFATMLGNYAPWPGPAYIAITGAVFAGLGMMLVWAIWRRAAWAPAALLSTTAAYAAWNWIDQLFVRPQLDAGWKFSALVTVALLAFVGAVALDSRNRRYFGKEAHERKEQDRSAS